MSASRVSPLRAATGFSEEQLHAVRKGFFDRGETIKDWAEARGYEPFTVYTILSGNRLCHRGISHRIAVDLGLKAAPHSKVNAPAKPVQHRLSAKAA
jgi:gp16 family phage-associated protein